MFRTEKSAPKAAMVDTADSIIADDRTSVLLRFHESFEDTTLPPIQWQIGAYDQHTGDDLRKWIRWKIWLKFWVWIDLSNMWLNVVSQNDDGELIHHRQLKSRQFSTPGYSNQEIRRGIHRIRPTPRR